MALIGIQLNRQNPEFTSADFTFWMPQYKNYVNYYAGKILVGETNQLAYVYSTDYHDLVIGTTHVELVTADEITYTGTITVGPVATAITYNITLNSETKVLTLSDGTTTTTCTLTSEGYNTYTQLYELANSKIFKSIYGSDWKYAMSLCIAHYLTLIADQVSSPSGNTLQGVVGGGTTRGVLNNMSVGEFSKSYELRMTMVDENEALFWNQTQFGASLMALLKTKAVPSILVVTSHPVPDAPTPMPPRPPFIP